MSPRTLVDEAVSWLRFPYDLVVFLRDPKIRQAPRRMRADVVWHIARGHIWTFGASTETRGPSIICMSCDTPLWEVPRDVPTPTG